MGAVAVDETDRGDADTERVEPRVRGLEQVEPETGCERVGEVVVALGRRPPPSAARAAPADRSRVPALGATSEPPLPHDNLRTARDQQPSGEG